MKYNSYVRFENLTAEISNFISDTETEYLSKLAAKLVNSSASAKMYWSIFNNLLMLAKFH